MATDPSLLPVIATSQPAPSACAAGCCGGTAWIRTGAILAGLAVALGAFGAHGLDEVLKANYAGKTKLVAGETVAAATKYLGDFRTAAEYQMYHALGILLFGILMQGSSCRGLRIAAWCHALGILLFSGSLYVLVLTGKTWLGAITPFGGTLFLAGWGIAAMSSINKPATATE